MSAPPTLDRPYDPDLAPVEDNYAGLLWTPEHATELGIVPKRLMIASTFADRISSAPSGAMSKM